MRTDRPETGRHRYRVPPDPDPPRRTRLHAILALTALITAVIEAGLQHTTGVLAALLLTAVFLALSLRGPGR